ncbi:hypothetical protein RFI_17155, partial [Reticulomyxa filosa]
MLSEKSRQYVQDIEYQLNYYRMQVATLLREVENLRYACNGCMDRMSQAQSDLTTARDELSGLLAQMHEVDERTNADKEDVCRLKVEMEQMRSQIDADKQALQWQLEHIKNEKEVLSEALSNERSKQAALQYEVSSENKYAKQVKELQDQLSMIEANKIQVQDQWEK